MKSEQEIHAVDGIAGSAFEKIVDSCGYEQPVIDFFKSDQTLVGVCDVFYVDRMIDDKCEIMVVVVLFVELSQLLYGDRRCHIGCHKCAAGETAAERQKIDRCAETRLQTAQCIGDFVKLRVNKCTRQLYVIVAVFEVYHAFRRCLGVGGTGDCGDVYRTVEKQVFCERK